MIPTKESHKERYRWLPNSDVVEVLKLQPGMNIAEIGAGAGDLILPISEALGSADHAFAIEMAPEPLARLRERSQDSRNVHVVEAPYHATPIAADSCDRVLMANLWTELPDPIAALHEAARLLREDGRLILIEWQAAAKCAEAPAPRIGFYEMIQLLEKNTWDIHRHGEIGPYSYFLEAAVSDESVQS
jgi:ubiquinone/menaquinone biosynthesis C-methylase UbiE